LITPARLPPVDIYRHRRSRSADDAAEASTLLLVSIFSPPQSLLIDLVNVNAWYVAGEMRGFALLPPSIRHA